MPHNVGGAGHFGGMANDQKHNDMQGGGQRRKNRVFAPVTMKMIQEAPTTDNDVCEIEGEAI